MTPLSRLPGWRGRFNAVIDAWARRPFEPGAADCALFAARCVEAITGVDLAADWRGSYATLAGGAAEMKRRGHATPLRLARSVLPEIARGAALPGDVCLFDRASDHAPRAFGVVQGRGVFVMGQSGLKLVPRAAPRWFFGVGHGGPV